MDNNDSWDDYEKKLSSLYDQQRSEKEEEIEDPIFSMMYLSGTIIQGKITGRWTPPGPSPTNSVLLWPDTFQYFSSEAQKIIKNKA